MYETGNYTNLCVLGVVEGEINVEEETETEQNTWFDKQFYYSIKDRA